MKGPILILLLSISFISNAQDSVTPEVENKDQTENEQKPKEDKPPLQDRIFFGGSFGAAFGDYTYFNISPIIGYKLSPTFSAGGGIIYQYNEDKRSNYSANNYGGRLFGIAKVYGPLFAQMEYEYLEYRYSSPFGEGFRGNYSSVFGGGGIAQPISKNAFFTATALYNFTYQNNVNGDYLPYDSPWVIRVGISAGF